jgi:hypothetical protein
MAAPHPPRAQAALRGRCGLRLLLLPRRTRLLQRQAAAAPPNTRRLPRHVLRVLAGALELLLALLTATLLLPRQHTWRTSLLLRMHQHATHHVLSSRQQLRTQRQPALMQASAAEAAAAGKTPVMHCRRQAGPAACCTCLGSRQGQRARQLLQTLHRKCPQQQTTQQQHLLSALPCVSSPLAASSSWWSHSAAHSRVAGASSTHCWGSTSCCCLLQAAAAAVAAAASGCRCCHAPSRAASSCGAVCQVSCCTQGAVCVCVCVCVCVQVCAAGGP